MRVSAVHVRVVVMLVVLTHVRCVACDFDVSTLQLRTSLWRCLPSRRCLWPLYGSRIKCNPSISKMRYTPVILTQRCVAHPAWSTCHRNSSIFSITREQSTWYVHQQQQCCMKK